jgi:hypothetical protein
MVIIFKIRISVSFIQHHLYMRIYGQRVHFNHYVYHVDNILSLFLYSNLHLFIIFTFMFEINSCVKIMVMRIGSGCSR